MPTGLYDTMDSSKKTDTPSVSVAQKQYDDTKLSLLKDYKKIAEEMKAIVNAQPGGKFTASTARIKLLKLYAGVARAVADRKLSAGKEYRDNYYEKTRAGYKKLVEQLIAGKTPEFPELLRLFEYDETARKDPDSKVMSVRDKNGDEVEISVA